MVMLHREIKYYKLLDQLYVSMMTKLSIIQNIATKNSVYTSMIIMRKVHILKELTSVKLNKEIQVTKIINSVSIAETQC